MGASGNPGPSGDQGHRGAQGQLGNTGAQGAQGPPTGTGSQGGPGPTGAQGNQGAQGPRAGQGAQGGPGGAGPQGAQGPGGPRGSQGPQGAQGAQSGVPGATGTPGPPGAQGSQGAQGPPGGGGGQGAQGAVGPPGSPAGQGSQGAQGPGGGPGPQGAQGATGPSSTTCYSRLWYFAFSISDFCACICDTIFYYSQYTFCDPSVNKYDDITNCQNSTCDWSGRGYQYGNCGGCCSFFAYFLNFTCGFASGYSTCAYSDSRLKHGVKTLKDVLKKIMEIEAVEYDWNENLPPQVYEFYKRRKKLHTIGLIAQNLRLVYPEAVMVNEDGYYSINYEKLNAVLVEGIKQQSLFIEDIDKELNQLESKLS